MDVKREFRLRVAFACVACAVVVVAFVAQGAWLHAVEQLAFAASVAFVAWAAKRHWRHGPPPDRP
jgi:hypothetical protein